MPVSARRQPHPKPCKGGVAPAGGHSAEQHVPPEGKLLQERRVEPQRDG